MKIRGKREAAKIEPQMAPMIDVVFQLLIFFMLTLKVIPPEGSHNINMPVGAPSTSSEAPVIPPLKVTLKAGTDGRLAEVRFGAAVVPMDPNNVEYVFDALNQRVDNSLGISRGTPLNKDAEVEIESDYNLHYEYTIRAVSAVMGKSQGEKVVRYVEKVKFAPPLRPGA